jgi:hypothetical protein
MENKRKTISKKLRFEVFKRDNFTCQYCSAKPPNVPLEIDHIIPVCKKGTNHIDNLITACFDCNRGKSGNELNSIPNTLSEKSEIKKIAIAQYREYQKILIQQKKQMEIDVLMVEEIYNSVYTEYVFMEKFKLSVKNFIKKLGVESVCESMEIACSKIHYDEQKVLKYFCGICWTKIKENE